jgi:putative solute:sodium symporter small subunit
MKPDLIAPMQQRRIEYWRRTRLLTAWLLSIWFVLTFTVIFFARELTDFTLFGWPFPFYMAAQGLIIVYLAIIGVYARQMKRLDKLMKGSATDDQ